MVVPQQGALALLILLNRIESDFPHLSTG
jgi:hypothetical protein